MTERSETIGVRLTPTEREKFEDFLRDSNEFDSMSRFFRVIAHRYIETSDEDPTLDPQEVIDAVDQAVAPLQQRIEQIEEHVISIDSNVRDDDKIDRLARDIYSSLPNHKDATELPNLDEVSQYANASDLALTQAISTPYLWSKYYDEDLADVRRGCARMLEYYPDVKFVTDSTGGSDSPIPVHEDIDLTPPPRHTDVSPGRDNRTSNRIPRVSEGDQNTVRRYYKTEGD
jgi:hypothetical protein